MTLRHGISFLAAALVLLVVVLSARTSPYVIERTQAEVVAIVDGDTVKVRDITNHLITVRIIGIDTPETKHPEKGVECYGPEASAFAEEFLVGSVVLAYSTKGDGVDKYGRTLAYVEANGQDYGLAALREGMARLYNGEAHDRQRKYIKAQAAAERELAGLWRECRR